MIFPPQKVIPERGKHGWRSHPTIIPSHNPMIFSNGDIRSGIEKKKNFPTVSPQFYQDPAPGLLAPHPVISVVYALHVLHASG
jgi:hypothetical protein